VVALVACFHIALGRSDREPDFELTAVEFPCHLQAGALEDAEHRAVLGHHFGDQALDACLAGPLCKLLQQPRADSPALVLVSDRESRLRRAVVAQPHVLRDGDDAVLELADQDAAVPPLGLEEVADETLVDAADSVKAKVEAPVREPCEERGEGARVFTCGRPQAQRRPVAEDHVDRGGRL
jgi:hypothetical protein